MTNSFYGMIYRGGIALPMGVENVVFLIEHNSEVELLGRVHTKESIIMAKRIKPEKIISSLS